ncbi:helix-turn-helix domain-containing protein [Cyanobacteria bacterium FACHB-63]|nr:helix-turn-helix domain-containing protein [Cyanobacteria bacterium FACHB-63]
MGRPRKKVQRDRDRASIAELRLKGWSQQRIAEYLEVDQSTVSRDLVALERQWKESSLRDFDAERGMQLEKLDLLEREYWDAWERSQASKESTISEQLRNAAVNDDGSPIASGGRVRQMTRTEQKIGDPQFLSGVLKCIGERSKLLGLYLDTKGDRTAEDTLKGYLNYLATSPTEQNASHD